MLHTSHGAGQERVNFFRRRHFCSALSRQLFNLCMCASLPCCCVSTTMCHISHRGLHGVCEWVCVCFQTRHSSAPLGRSRLFVEQSCLCLSPHAWIGVCKKRKFVENKHNAESCHCQHMRVGFKRLGSSWCALTLHRVVSLLATASGLNELASILSLEHSHSSLTEAPFSHLAVVWQQTGVISNQ